MKYPKFLFFLLIFIFNTLLYAQFTQAPSLSHKKQYKTLSIDSIPVQKPLTLTISNIYNATSNYRCYFNSPIGIQYPSYGISDINRLVVNSTSGSLSQNNVYNLIRERSWDNPYGANSFAEGVLNATFNTIFDVFKIK